MTMTVHEAFERDRELPLKQALRAVRGGGLPYLHGKRGSMARVRVMLNLASLAGRARIIASNAPIKAALEPDIFM